MEKFTARLEATHSVLKDIKIAGTTHILIYFNVNMVQEKDLEIIYLDRDCSFP